MQSVCYWFENSLSNILLTIFLFQFLNERVTNMYVVNIRLSLYLFIVMVWARYKIIILYLFHGMFEIFVALSFNYSLQRINSRYIYILWSICFVGKCTIDTNNHYVSHHCVVLAHESQIRVYFRSDTGYFTVIKNDNSSTVRNYANNVYWEKYK